MTKPSLPLTEVLDDDSYFYVCNFRCGHDDYGLVAIQFLEPILGAEFPVMLLDPELAEKAAMAMLQVCKNMSGESVQ